MTIDVKKLRDYLTDYYGSASKNGNPMALIELSNVELASGYELVEIAKKIKINLEDFTLNDDYER